MGCDAGSQTTPASNLCAGTSVTITDDVGCSASTSVLIEEPDIITIHQKLTDLLVGIVM